MATRSLVFAAAACCVGLITSSAWAVNPASGTTSTGQNLNIEITSPVDGALVDHTLPLVVQGQTAIGALSLDANVAYVIDVSCSTWYPLGQDCNGDGGVDAADDINADGRVGDTLDCEIAGVISLNESFSSLVGVDGSVVAFASSAAVADVDPAAGAQAATTPLDADYDIDGVPDLEQVARSMEVGWVYEFTAYGVGTGTNFNAALASMNAAFATQPAGEANVAFFLSDGVGTLSTGVGSPLDASVAAGTVVHTYSIGGSGSGCGATSNLFRIADFTGGTCTVVTDPSDLSGALSGTTPDGIDSVSVSLNGGVAMPASLGGLGHWTADFGAAPYKNGWNTLHATVLATDGTAVTADISFYTLMNQPPVAACADQTLYADDLCQACGSVDDGSYDPDGEADIFAITEAPACPWELGVTPVTLTIEDLAGETDTCTANVEVLDVTPPTVSCNAPATITPPDAPITFTATTADNCAAEVNVVGYWCWAINGVGRVVDKTDSCIVSWMDDQLTIEDSGGVGDHIEWTVQAVDSSGNTTTELCSVWVVNPGKVAP